MIDHWFVFYVLDGTTEKYRRAFKNNEYACTYAARMALKHQTKAWVVDVITQQQIFCCEYQTK